VNAPRQRASDPLNARKRRVNACSAGEGRADHGARAQLDDGVMRRRARRMPSESSQTMPSRRPEQRRPSQNLVSLPSRGAARYSKQGRATAAVPVAARRQTGRRFQARARRARVKSAVLIARAPPATPRTRAGAAEPMRRPATGADRVHSSHTSHPLPRTNSSAPTAACTASEAAVLAQHREIGPARAHAGVCPTCSRRQHTAAHQRVVNQGKFNDYSRAGQ